LLISKNVLLRKSCFHYCCCKTLTLHKVE